MGLFISLEKGRSRKEHEQVNKGGVEQAQPRFYWLKLLYR
jgi:hypothetical protein